MVVLYSLSLDGCLVFLSNLSSLDGRPGVLEPVDDVVHVEWLFTTTRIETVEDCNVLLNLNYSVLDSSKVGLHLQSGRVVVKLEPLLQLGNLMLWVEAYSHPWSGFRTREGERWSTNL